MRLKNLELIRRNDAIAILLDANCVHDMKVLYPYEKPMYLDFDKIPLQSAVPVSWLYFKLEKEGILSACSSNTLEFLQNLKDIRSVRFIFDNGKASMLILPWLGQNENMNEAISVSADVEPNLLVFEAGFPIA